MLNCCWFSFLFLFFRVISVQAVHLSNQLNDRPSFRLFIWHPFKMYFSFCLCFILLSFCVFFYYMGRLLNKMFPSSLFSSSVAVNLFTNSYSFRLYIFFISFSCLKQKQICYRKNTNKDDLVYYIINFISFLLISEKKQFITFYAASVIVFVIVDIYAHFVKFFP